MYFNYLYFNYFTTLQSGKALCWDVTVTCPLADSYVAAAAREAGSAAELAAARKEVKYSSIDGRYLFEPIAIETLGVYSTSARQLLADLGKLAERFPSVRGQAWTGHCVILPWPLRRTQAPPGAFEIF